jgi:hypothetical protein
MILSLFCSKKYDNKIHNSLMLCEWIKHNLIELCYLLSFIAFTLRKPNQKLNNDNRTDKSEFDCGSFGLLSLFRTHYYWTHVFSVRSLWSHSSEESRKFYRINISNSLQFCCLCYWLFLSLSHFFSFSHILTLLFLSFFLLTFLARIDNT